MTKLSLDVSFTIDLEELLKEDNINGAMIAMGVSTKEEFVQAYGYMISLLISKSVENHSGVKYQKAYLDVANEEEPATEEEMSQPSMKDLLDNVERTVSEEDQEEHIRLQEDDDRVDVFTD